MRSELDWFGAFEQRNFVLAESAIACCSELGTRARLGAKTKYFRSFSAFFVLFVTASNSGYKKFRFSPGQVR